MNRRSKPPNRWGCKPDGDVCVEHDMPLICRHGCQAAADHRCAGYEPLSTASVFRIEPAATKSETSGNAP